MGLEEGLFPHMRSLESEPAIEEERRLMYVGVTRAEDMLYLTLARKRMMIGKGAPGGFSTNYSRPSRFLAEITPGLLSGYYPAPEPEAGPAVEIFDEFSGGDSFGGGNSNSRFGNRAGNANRGYNGGESKYGNNSGYGNSYGGGGGSGGGGNSSDSRYGNKGYAGGGSKYGDDFVSRGGSGGSAGSYGGSSSSSRPNNGTHLAPKTMDRQRLNRER